MDSMARATLPLAPSCVQLVLPQFLKAFPVYLNSLRKSEVLLPGLRSSIPQRLQLRSRLVSMDARSTALYFYPLLLHLVSAVPRPLGHINGRGLHSAWA